MTEHGEPSDDHLMHITDKTQPIDLLNQWILEAKANPGIRESNAMILSTSGVDDEIHSRTVLCKACTEEGLAFYTNYLSPKGRDLARNPHAAATFYWDSMARQVNIFGQATRTSRANSEAYWSSRSRESQLSQHISRQSEPVTAREQLDQEWARADQEFKNKPIPCPAHWGGYILKPKHIEFWIGRPGRLHDRFLFEKCQNGWTFRRLYP